jgi:hypothetical protein
MNWKLLLGTMTLWGGLLGLASAEDSSASSPDYLVQGEYRGNGSLGGQDAEQLGAQVIALGEGKFTVVLYSGGLPGEGWDRSRKKESFDAKTDNSETAFKGEKLQGTIRKDTLKLTTAKGESAGELKKVERRSPTLGATPPAGAVVLLDKAPGLFDGGGHADAERNLVMGPKPGAEEFLPNGKRKHGDATTKESFGSFVLHLEFRTPFMPTDSGQKRGNSGVYLQNRYECQVLDSFGLEGEDNECGGFYKAKRPDVNMCFPPLTWQTYDIEFTAPQFDAAGKKTKNARVTVRQNGVVIHRDVELPGITPGGLKDEGSTGPLKLQDHNNPVAYRNIWIVPKG